MKELYFLLTFTFILSTYSMTIQKSHSNFVTRFLTIGLT